MIDAILSIYIQYNDNNKIQRKIVKQLLSQKG